MNDEQFYIVSACDKLCLDRDSVAADPIARGAALLTEAEMRAAKRAHPGWTAFKLVKMDDPPLQTISEDGMVTILPEIGARVRVAGDNLQGDIFGVVEGYGWQSEDGVVIRRRQTDDPSSPVPRTFVIVVRVAAESHNDDRMLYMRPGNLELIDDPDTKEETP